jgi:hypothetical protein
MWPFKTRNQKGGLGSEFWKPDVTEASRLSGSWDFKQSVSSPLDTTDPVTAFEEPPKSQSLYEIAENHRHGPFEYVTITSTVSYSKKELQNVLLAKLGDAKTRTTELTDFPVVLLKGSTLDLTVDKAIISAAIQRAPRSVRNKAMKGTLVDQRLLALNHVMDFISLNAVFYNFDPAGGFGSDISFVKVSLIDNRLKVPKVLRSVIHNSNLSFSCVFALDHSIYKADLGRLTLRIENPKNPYTSDIVWGSATFDMTVVESDRSITNDLLPVTGTHRIGYTLLTEHRRNPREFDASITEVTRKALISKMKAGQIMDRTKIKSKQMLDFSKLMGSAADVEDLAARENDFDSEDQEPSIGVTQAAERVARMNNNPQYLPSQPIASTSEQVPAKPPQFPHHSLGSVPTTGYWVSEASSNEPVVLSPRNPFRTLSPDVTESPTSSSMPSDEKGKRVVRVMSPRSKPMPLQHHSPTIPKKNHQLVESSNLGSQSAPIQVVASAEHPFVIATTDALPAHSKLFEGGTFD